jgi:hypothetical protein
MTIELPKAKHCINKRVFDVKTLDTQLENIANVATLMRMILIKRARNNTFTDAQIWIATMILREIIAPHFNNLTEAILTDPDEEDPPLIRTIINYADKITFENETPYTQPQTTTTPTP